MSLGSPQTDADWAQVIASTIAFFAAIWTIFTYPFKTFLTRKSAEMTYLKIVNPDGTRPYVHPTELIAINSKLDKIIEHLNIQ